MKKVLIILLLFVLCIEVGMRIAIWRALDEIVPQNATYRLEVTLLDNSLFRSCHAYGNEENNYMNVFYSLWLVSIIDSWMICEYQSPYITLRVDPPNLNFYHWSFHRMRFEEDQQNRLPE
ncbi:hypothetical protein [Citrobacter freundii]|uniref:hypothetical protein n=1 Tax=Citrobacter freundii TaxID=546 RepID=UPI001906E955|nr:hypothetical protein [Citrobacter freundii]MBJ9196362.1 hypothetical protein [Citrobacter freundii]